MGETERLGKGAVLGVFRQAIRKFLNVPDRFRAAFGVETDRNFQIFFVHRLHQNDKPYLAVMEL